MWHISCLIFKTYLSLLYNTTKIRTFVLWISGSISILSRANLRIILILLQGPVVVNSYTHIEYWEQLRSLQTSAYILVKNLYLLKKWKNNIGIGQPGPFLPVYFENFFLCIFNSKAILPNTFLSWLENAKQQNNNASYTLIQIRINDSRPMLFY